MKIAHIVCSYPPYYGGMGNVVLQTVQELGKRGHEVEVLTPLYQTQPGTSPENFEEPVKEQVDYARRITPRVQYGNAAHIPEIIDLILFICIIHFLEQQILSENGNSGIQRSLL